MPGLGFIQDFAYEVNRTLVFVDVAWFVPLDHHCRGDNPIGCCYVKEQVLVRLRCCEDRWCGEESFELGECSVSFLCLGEFFRRL